jgi:hypothetical protein
VGGWRWRASMGLAWVNWEMSLNLLVLGILPRMARWGREVFLMIHSTEIASEMVMPSSTPSTTALITCQRLVRLHSTGGQRWWWVVVGGGHSAYR